MVKKKSENDIDALVSNALIKKEDQPYPVPDNWVWVKANEIIDTSISGFACSKKFEVDEDDKNGFPHLRPNNIGFGGQLNLQKIVYIPSNKIDEGKNHLEAGSIIFNNTNSKELVGRAVLIDNYSPFAFSNPHALAGTTKHETLEKIEGRS